MIDQDSYKLLLWNDKRLTIRNRLRGGFTVITAGRCCSWFPHPVRVSIYYVHCQCYLRAPDRFYYSIFMLDCKWPCFYKWLWCNRATDFCDVFQDVVKSSKFDDLPTLRLETKGSGDTCLLSRNCLYSTTTNTLTRSFLHPIWSYPGMST